MKKIFKSKTVWVGVVTFLLGGFMALESQMPTMGWVIMGKAVVDILLRVITTESVKV